MVLCAYVVCAIHVMIVWCILCVLCVFVFRSLCVGVALYDASVYVCVIICPVPEMVCSSVYVWCYCGFFVFLCV